MIKVVFDSEHTTLVQHNAVRTKTEILAKAETVASFHPAWNGHDSD